MDLRVGRGELCRRGEMHGAFGGLALAHQDYAQVAVGLAVVGVQMDGLPAKQATARSSLACIKRRIQV